MSDETTIYEDEPIALEFDPQKEAELIERMENHEEKLSFTSISNFAKSPRHFMLYKLLPDDKRETPAMLLGSVIDCLITEPDNFADKYRVAPENAKMNSLEGLDVWAEFLGIELYGKKDEKTAQIKAVLANSDFKVIDAITYKQAERIANAVIRNEAATYVLSRVTETQKKLTWEYGGWNWSGKPDFVGEKMIADLKLTADAKPRMCEYVIKEKYYTWQQALYGQGKDQDHFIIMADRSGSVSVHEVTRRSILNAWAQIDDALAGLERCIYRGDWWASYDFWAMGKIYRI